MKTQIIEKIRDIATIINEEARQCRDYGTGHSLYHSEVHLIVAIFNHRDANASELAQALDITNGAVTQVADKLSKKGLIERYQVKGNKKDTFFRLTEQGEQIYWGHEKHHNKMNTKVMEYLEDLDDDQVKLIVTFLDKVIEGFALN